MWWCNVCMAGYKVQSIDSQSIQFNSRYCWNPTKQSGTKMRAKVLQLILRCGHTRLLVLQFIIYKSNMWEKSLMSRIGLGGHYFFSSSIICLVRKLNMSDFALSSHSWSWSAFVLVAGNFPSNLASYLCFTVSISECICTVCAAVTSQPLKHTHTGLSLYSNNDLASCTHSLSLMTGYDYGWLDVWLAVWV